MISEKSLYKFVDHQADLAVVVEADDREGLFLEALTALSNLISGRIAVDGTETGEDHSHNRESQVFTLRAIGYDDEERLVALLNELLYACQVDCWLPLEIESVRFDKEGGVTSQLRGISGMGSSELKRKVKATT